MGAHLASPFHSIEILNQFGNDAYWVGRFISSAYCIRFVNGRFEHYNCLKKLKFICEIDREKYIFIACVSKIKNKTKQKSITYIFDLNKNSEHFLCIYYIRFILAASYNAVEIYGALRAKPPAFPFVNSYIL